MKAYRHPALLLAALLLGTGPLLAQQPTAPAQPPARPALPPPPDPLVGPPIERIETASALSTEPLTAITGVRELPDGRVLVNDGQRRRVLLMDTTLTVVAVVLDSLSSIANTYGPRAGGLIPYRADSTLFVDAQSLAIVVIDPAGEITRVRSVWRAQDVAFFSSTTGLYGYPGVDARGRVVYRINAQTSNMVTFGPGGMPIFPQQADSGFVVAADLDTRRIDTLGVVRLPRTVQRARMMGEGRWSVEFVTNPLPASDQWAVTPDGTVAFVRWRDYRIEYIDPDGSTRSSGKLPYEWQRLVDEDKERLVDSVRVAQQAAAMRDFVSSMITWSNRFGKPYPADFVVPEDVNVMPGIPRDWILPPGLRLPPNYLYGCAPGEEPTTPAPGAPGAPGAPPPPPPPGMPIPVGSVPGGAAPGMPSCIPQQQSMYGMMFGPVGGAVTPPPPTLRPVAVAPATDLPDYRPPFPSGATGAVRADYEGNLWIRTHLPRSVPGGIVYDIVNAEGELVRRLQIPQGYTLVGFGRDRVVYLSTRDATGLKLARVRLR